MRWLLVVVIMNTPVKTDLVFESLDSCLQAEGKMRAEWTALYNGVKAASAEQDSLEFIKTQMPFGTCVPTK